MFGAAVRDPNHEFGKFPEDYTLFHVGEFDQETGIFNPNPAPRAVVSAVVLLASRENGK